jgi:hypothetical protein
MRYANHKQNFPYNKKRDFDDELPQLDQFEQRDEIHVARAHQARRHAHMARHQHHA